MTFKRSDDSKFWNIHFLVADVVWDKKSLSTGGIARIINRFGACLCNNNNNNNWIPYTVDKYLITSRNLACARFMFNDAVVGFYHRAEADWMHKKWNK